MNYAEEILQIKQQLGEAYTKLGQLGRRMEDQGGLAEAIIEVREAQSRTFSAWLQTGLAHGVTLECEIEG